MKNYAHDHEMPDSNNGRKADTASRAAELPAKGSFEGAADPTGLLDNFAHENLSFGVTLGHHDLQQVFQMNEDRFRHTVIIGRTGSGKSNHIQQMEREDIRNGAGVFILAAHEDDALYPLSCVPDERLADVVFIDASNPEFLPRMNPLDVDPSDQAAVSKAIDDVLELVTMDSYALWNGPRFEKLLRDGLGLIMCSPDPDDRCIQRLSDVYTDPDFARSLLCHCTDKSLYDQWTKVIPQEKRSSDSGETTHWFLSKVSRFMSDRVLAHVFGAGRSTIDIQGVVDEGKILVAYVPESRIGATAARTISKWLVMQLRDAIMNRRAETGGWGGMNYGRFEGREGSRSDVDPFFVYVDEFAKFAREDFARLLAEARKQRVGFVLSFQTLSQTRAFDIKTGQTGTLEEAILGNVGSVVCYPMGIRDARELSRHFDQGGWECDLYEIERYQPVARLCQNNKLADPTTLDVGIRPEPDNPSAPRRVALHQVLTGNWIPVGDTEGHGFLDAVRA